MSKCHPNPRDLDKILPTGLQNCPRAYGPWAVLEALGQDFIQNPSGLGWHFLPKTVNSSGPLTGSSSGRQMVVHAVGTEQKISC